MLVDGASDSFDDVSDVGKGEKVTFKLFEGGIYLTVRVMLMGPSNIRWR